MIGNKAWRLTAAVAEFHRVLLPETGSGHRAAGLRALSLVSGRVFQAHGRQRWAVGGGGLPATEHEHEHLAFHHVPTGRPTRPGAWLRACLVGAVEHAFERVNDGVCLVHKVVEFACRGSVWVSLYRVVKFCLQAMLTQAPEDVLCVSD